MEIVAIWVHGGTIGEAPPGGSSAKAGRITSPTSRTAPSPQISSDCQNAMSHRVYGPAPSEARVASPARPPVKACETDRYRYRYCYHC